MATRSSSSKWPQDTREAMTALARLFPSLRAADGIDPWDATRLIDWLNGPAVDASAAWAGRFVLDVWHQGTDWNEFGLKGAGRFELLAAIGRWDREHVEALQTWIDSPFWP